MLGGAVAAGARTPVYDELQPARPPYST